MAIAIGVEARHTVQMAQSAARRAGFSVRWVNPANAHLTLKFLGATDSGRVATIGTALGEVVARRPAFLLQTSMIGGFPNLRRPSVLWLGLGGALRHLAALQEAVEAALVQQGIPVGVRPFSPHLTLGRLSRGTAVPNPDAVAALAASADFAGATVWARSVQLMRSELAHNGALYTTLYDLPLTDVGG